MGRSDRGNGISVSARIRGCSTPNPPRLLKPSSNSISIVSPAAKRPPSGTLSRTRGNRIAVFPGDPALAGRTVEFRVHRVTSLTLIGEVASAPTAG